MRDREPSQDGGSLDGRALGSLVETARAWLDADPDPADRAETEDLLRAAGGTGSEAQAAAAELADRFAGPLTFGTAGLRGPLRAGPNGMNTAVVRRAAAGLAAWLLSSKARPDRAASLDDQLSDDQLSVESRGVAPEPTDNPRHEALRVDVSPARDDLSAEARGMAPDSADRPTGDRPTGDRPTSDRPTSDRPTGDGRRLTIVVGFDGRHRSEQFALDSARVFAAAGLRALVLPGPLPTPVLAFAVRHLAADAGVMVTASHNPAADNGYKVYVGGAPGDPGRGAQLVAPADAQIEAAIAAAPAAADVPLARTWTRLGDETVAAYVAAAADTGAGTSAGSGGPGPERSLLVAYTPLHGVGLRVLRRVFAAAGLPEPAVVPEQAEPDPGFPTAAFPNPEVPGVLDRVLALGRHLGADLVLANDPDADRLAVAVGDRVLTGDELGLLLADEVLRERAGPVATTVVSATALRRLAARRGVRYAETLTGFKWIMRAAPDLVFGYEEALGYAVRPELVRDKDGITAAVAVARMAAAEAARGRTLLDRLDDLTRELGPLATAQVSLSVPDLAAATALLRGLRAAPPAELAGRPVEAVRDLLTPPNEDLPRSALPRSDVLIFQLGGDARVVVRPSGTEPKIKVYLQAADPGELGPLTAWARGLASGRARPPG